MDTVTHVHDVAIIGGGPAGYAAAIYAARASLDVVVIEQGMPGGQIATTETIENYPGIEQISGFELGQNLQDHAASVGVECAYGVVSAIRRCEDGSFIVEADPDSYAVRAVIVATGAKPRHIGFEGEERFAGRGVSYCATCDGMFYRGKDVFVIGGGTAACEEALYLSRIARSVTMVVRRDVFRAPKGVVDRMLAADNIEVRFETSITAVDGENAISSITFRDKDMATRTPGIFCAGDMRSKHLRQVITAAADGAIAGMSAYRYIVG